MLSLRVLSVVARLDIKHKSKKINDISACVAVPSQNFTWRMIPHRVHLLVMAVSVWVTILSVGAPGKALTAASQTSTTSFSPCLLFSSALLWRDGLMFCTGYLPSILYVSFSHFSSSLCLGL